MKNGRSDSYGMKRGLQSLIPILGMNLLCFSSAWGAVFTVNSSSDTDDGLCDDAHCSFREAINSANTNPGKDTIEFNIPVPGPHTIAPTSALPTITDPVIIDGYTQPGASPNTNGIGAEINTLLEIELDGGSAGTAVDGLRLQAGDSTVRGIAISGFAGNGILIEAAGGNIIEGNFIGTDISGTSVIGNSSGIYIHNSASNLIGGTTPQARNLLSGSEFKVLTAGIVILGSGAAGNIVQGNFIGTDATGTAALGNHDGVLVRDAPDNLIGGATVGAGNLISGSDIRGVLIELGATGSIVQGNLIGTEITGTQDLGNAASGIVIGTDAVDCVIGGATENAGNVISGNDLHGIEIYSSGNLIQGNLIGTDVAGTSPLGNTLTGILIGTGTSVSSENSIGGVASGEGNVIAYNGSDGVQINSGTGNLIRGNSMFSNNGLGIDLAGDNVTPNDPGDTDTGPNESQNFPNLQSATGNGAITITGILDSSPESEFLLEFFANAQHDPSGHGEGQNFIGSTVVTTDDSGNANFMISFPNLFPANRFITATATDSGNNTSEFSQYITVMIEVQIDIKPGGMPNSINLKSRGEVPVAILTTDSFDASTVDPTSCTFAGASPVRWHLEDIDNDGDYDMLLHFMTRELALAEDSLEALLAAETYDGTQIFGKDSVKIVP